MKKIIFVLLLILSTCLTAQAQKETVVRYGATDVTLTLDKGESLNMTFVRSASGTDTLQVYAVFSNPYRESLLGGVNQADRSVSTTLIVTNSPKTYNFSTAGAPKIVVKMLDVDSSVVLISYAVGNSTLGFRSDPASLYGVPGVWTVPQYFSSATVDLLTVNHIDSAQSIRLYDTGGVLYALFSADTSWIPSLTVGDLATRTIINGGSIMTNKIYSDSIIGGSPVDIIADTVRVKDKLFAKSINNDGHLYFNLYGVEHLGILYASYIRSSYNFIPASDYGASLGKYNQRWDTIQGKVGRFSEIRPKDESSYMDIHSSGNTGQVRLFIGNGGGDGQFVVLHQSAARFYYSEYTKSLAPWTDLLASLGTHNKRWDSLSVNIIKTNFIQAHANWLVLRDGSGTAFQYVGYGGSTAFIYNANPYQDYSTSLGKHDQRWDTLGVRVVKNSSTNYINFATGNFQLGNVIRFDNGGDGIIGTNSFRPYTSTLNSATTLGTETYRFKSAYISKVVSDTLEALRYNFTSATDFIVSTGGVDRWKVSSAGDWLPMQNNTYDLGSVDYKIKNTYVAGYIYLSGDANTDGSWRISATNSGSFLVEARITGTWTAKQTLTF